MVFTLEQVIQAIQQVDEGEQPEDLFHFIPEDIIWANATTILDNPELTDYGPTLLQSIHNAFRTLKDRKAVCTVLLHVLQFSKDSLTYRVAQHVILDYAKEWDKKFARQLYTLFEQNYQDGLEGDNPFTTQLALEGAVMFPICREDDVLLHRAISLLIGDFPPIPEQPEDAAALPVKALKLLTYCYDHFPSDHAILQQVNRCVESKNFSVSSEARFAFGIIHLYNAFSATDENRFLEALNAAAEHFKAATTSEEKRTDAELLAEITHCYILFLQSGSPENIETAISHAKEILTERLLAFGGLNQGYSNEIEMQLMQIVTNLAHWVHTLKDATRWPELTPHLHLLADIYAAVRVTDSSISQATYRHIPEITKNFVMLPYLHGRFVQIQEAISKMTTLLADEQWRNTASPSELEFCQLIIKELKKAPSPKEWAAKELEKVQMAATKDNPAFAEFLANLLKNNKDLSEGIVQLAQFYLHQSIPNFSDIPFHEGPAKEICDRIIPALREKLDWPIHELKWIFLRYAIRLVVNFLIRIYRITPGEATPDDVSFLFAEGIKGLKGQGENATEKDLENYFYRSMCISNFYGSIERQSISIAPGKPDLNFRFSDYIFPIEIKRELKDVSQEHIYKRYVAQSQSYAAALHGIGFLFVLDLTPKPLKTPLRSVVDCCYIDHRPAPNSIRDDYVIVVIFPANRPRPSDHSWRTQRIKQPGTL